MFPGLSFQLSTDLEVSLKEKLKRYIIAWVFFIIKIIIHHNIDTSSCESFLLLEWLYIHIILGFVSCLNKSKYWTICQFPNRYGGDIVEDDVDSGDYIVSSNNKVSSDKSTGSITLIALTQCNISTFGEITNVILFYFQSEIENSKVIAPELIWTCIKNAEPLNALKCRWI